MNSIQKPLEQKYKKELKKNISKSREQKDTSNRTKNRKLEEKFLPQDQKEKSVQKQLLRLRNQTQKDYKTFIPQSKILKKVEFQKPL